MEKIPKKTIQSVFFKSLMIIIKLDIRGFGVMLFFQVILGLVPSVNLLVLQKLINTVQKSPSATSTSVELVLLYTGLSFLSYVLNQLDNYNSFIIGKKVSLFVETEVLEKTKSMNLHEFENAETYNIIQRAQAQSGENVFEFIRLVIQILKTVIIIASNSIILILWRWWIVIILIIQALIKIFVLSKYNKQIYLVHKARTNDERKKWYYQFLLTSDFSFKELQIFGTRDFFIKRFKHLSKEFISQDKRLTKKYTISDTILSGFDALVIAICFIISIFDIRYGVTMIGNFVVNINCITLIKSSMDTLVEHVVTIGKQVLDLSYLFDLFELKNGHTLKIEYQKVNIGKIRTIELRNVSFRYPNAKSFALKNIDLYVNEQEAIAIVGLNGSGKSTLLKLIAGFYDMYSGEILINGIELKQIFLPDYQEKIGMLFQDFTKYEMTLRENICMSKLDEIDNQEKILTVMKLVGLQENKFEDLNKQLGYWFDEGTQLSGGQWVKIAIARALFRDSSMIVLDEPNASLDPISETLIFRNYMDLIKGKIGFVITHRVSNAKDISDRILVFQDGKVVGDGRHENLLINCPLYSRLCDEEQR